MVDRKNTIKLDKKDYFRALMTDTIPSDIPVIFSNDGLYINAHRVRLKKVPNTTLDQIVENLFSCVIDPDLNPSLGVDGKSQSSPHKYKILKNDVSLRTLSLIHPRAQVNFVKMYDEHRASITYLCSLSPISIRAPIKVGSSFYSSKFKNSQVNKYKDISIDTLEDELKKRYASTYFSYRGVDRIYKFFNQGRYVQLEKRFSHMWFLDVANCFDSIYTHTIAWAIKDKEYIKNHTSYVNQFCQKFDTLMQRSNNNETNGIPIGSEVSRVFAEVIFQKVDLNITYKAESEFSLKYDEDYVVLRYVDDYILFAKNEKDMKIVSNVISDCLNEYNLYFNESKLDKYSRPFCTEKSNTVIALNGLVDEFDSSLLSVEFSSNIKTTKSKKIFHKTKFIHAFINKVRRLCFSKHNGYADVSSYLISSFSLRIINLTSTVNFTNRPSEESSELIIELRDAISILIELMFFFYSVYPTISSSNKMAKTIIIADEFFKKVVPAQLGFIRTEIMSHINLLSLEKNVSDIQRGFISIERMNIVLASSDFGSNYLLSNEVFEPLFEHPEKIDYFTIVCLLYYFKNHKQYECFKSKLEKIISEKIDGEIKLHRCSERAHLFLDILSCPFISKDLKKCLLLNFYAEYKLPSKNDVELESEVDLLVQTYWFIKWHCNPPILNRC